MVECILLEFSKGDSEYSVELGDGRIIRLGNGRPELLFEQYTQNHDRQCKSKSSARVHVVRLIDKHELRWWRTLTA